MRRALVEIDISSTIILNLRWKTLVEDMQLYNSAFDIFLKNNLSYFVVLCSCWSYWHIYDNDLCENKEFLVNSVPVLYVYRVFVILKSLVCSYECKLCKWYSWNSNFPNFVQFVQLINLWLKTIVFSKSDFVWLGFITHDNCDVIINIDFDSWYNY